MRAFFSADVGMTFEPFGLWHVLVLSVVIVSVLVLFLMRKRIRISPHEKTLRIVFGVMGILFEVSLHVWSLANGIWTYAGSAPVAVCFLSLAMGVYVMFTMSKPVFDIGYFWAIGGVVSVLFPDIPFGPDRFRFYQFLFSHMFFFLMFMYMLFVHRYRPDFRSFVKSLVILFVFSFVFVLPLDWLTGANFLFFVSPDGTPFEVVWGHGYLVYYIGIFVFGLAVLTVWYVPIHILNTIEKRVERKRLMV
jgi:hypothetical integral membrane protein (TIGR02206 family)